MSQRHSSIIIIYSSFRGFNTLRGSFSAKKYFTRLRRIFEIIFLKSYSLDFPDTFRVVLHPKILLGLRAERVFPRIRVKSIRLSQLKMKIELGHIPKRPIKIIAQYSTCIIILLTSKYSMNEVFKIEYLKTIFELFLCLPDFFHHVKNAFRAEYLFSSLRSSFQQTDNNSHC